MNRLRRFTAVVSVVFTAMTVMACGPVVISPRDLVVYKPNPKRVNVTQADKRVQASNMAWCELAGNGVKPADVASVMSLNSEDLSHLNVLSQNAFERWLCGNPAAQAYVLLAKQCEETRNMMKDPWWYPETEDDEYLFIEDIEERAMRHSGKEMQGRYVLLAVRALVTQGKWQQCVDYWNRVEKDVTCQAVRDLVEPNLVGCRYHLGDSVGALNDFIRLGDVNSVEFCSKQMKVDWMDGAEQNPELTIYEEYLQNYLLWLDHTLNSGGIYGGVDEMSPREKSELMAKCRRYRDRCMKIVREMNPDNAALWLYAAAAMSDALGEYSQAIALCDRSARAGGHERIDERLAVLKFHVQACGMPMGAAYESMLYDNMMMLTGFAARDSKKFGKDIDQEVARSEDPELLWLYYWQWRTGEDPAHYWHDMLYRIVVGEAGPRLVAAGKTTLALMATNVAEGYLAQVLGVDTLMRVYDNSTFMMADSLSLPQLKRYMHTLESPSSDFEKWLATYCYKDSDYWNELLGTRCLRDMNYQGAISYLEKVSPEYQLKMNIVPYFKYDPMRHQDVSADSVLNYKLNYARAMLVAQNTMRTARDPNKRALAMLRMAIGLENAADGHKRLAAHSFFEDLQEDYPDLYANEETSGRDWQLLRYGIGSQGSLCQADVRALKQQIALSRQLKKRAFDTFTDREIAARCWVEMCGYKTVLKRYPETVTADILRSRCDELRYYR